MIAADAFSAWWPLWQERRLEFCPSSARHVGFDAVPAIFLSSARHAYDAIVGDVRDSEQAYAY